jgi:hypothetical protein
VTKRIPTIRAVTDSPQGRLDRTLRHSRQGHLIAVREVALRRPVKAARHRPVGSVTLTGRAATFCTVLQQRLLCVTHVTLMTLIDGAESRRAA